MASIRLEGLRKRYPGGPHEVVRGLDLEITDGELLVLVGPSGCGKSTVLRLVAGLERPSDGRIVIGGRDVTALEPQRRDLAMVFQSYALYPHKTVAENLAFGLRMAGAPRATIAARVQATAQALGLDDLLARRPAELSGGQRQRVALGRALVRQPQAFLLDEPLSNLDAGLRAQTRAEIARLHQRLGTTMLYVTHDQEEAMTLGGRIAVMNDGVLQQVAPPLEVYHRPANRFVAGFVGSPPMNFITCTPTPAGLSAQVLARPLPLRTDGDAPVTLGVRPHDLRLDDGGADLRARVDLIEALGRETLVHLVAGDATRLCLSTPAEVALRPGDVVGVALARDRLHLFAADGARLAPAALG